MALLQQKGCEVHAYAQPGEARQRLEQRGIVCHDVPIQRSPLQLKNWTALRILTKSFQAENFSSSMYIHQWLRFSDGLQPIEQVSPAYCIQLMVFIFLKVLLF